MSDEIKVIGEMFREKRQEMNLSLKEVENATSIRMVYLQGIEEGEISQFPSPIYVLGFIRQYACFLGFDGDKLVAENPAAFSMPKQDQNFSYGIGTLEKREISKGKGGSISNYVWIPLTGFILIAAWYFAKYLGVI